MISSFKSRRLFSTPKASVPAKVLSEEEPRHLPFLSQSPESCDRNPSGKCQAGVRLSHKPEVVEWRAGEGLRQEME